jgi:ubiquinone/menaquinone biosynthesis C-methylase UbiE/DNA-binding transcriptional ArsR family regulator
MLAFEDLVSRLRAAAEPTRLRLLAVCAEGELTVTEICRVIGQSQPRVSRHLKLLCDAGLLVRFREEHCVYYRAPIRGTGEQVARRLLEWLDEADPVLDRDRRRAAQVREQRLKTVSPARAQANAGEDRELRDALLQEIGAAPVGELLDVGTGTGRILCWLAPRASQAVGIDLASEALRAARSSVHGAGFSHCVLQKGDMYELPFAAATFDTVTMERTLTAAQRPLDALAEAARVLRPGGRLVLIEDFDGLEARHETSAGHPLAVVRDWLAHAELDCERLRPIDCGSSHLLLALGRRRGALNVAA